MNNNVMKIKNKIAKKYAIAESTERENMKSCATRIITPALSVVWNSSYNPLELQKKYALKCNANMGV